MTARLFLLLTLLAAALLAAAPDALAQAATGTGDFNVSLGEDMLSSRRLFQMIVLLSVLSLAPSILLMVTSFTRIIIVFSLLRSALGLQNTPPNPVLVSLALFLTMFIMGPVLQQSYEQGIGPYIEERLDEEAAFEATVAPLRLFMVKQVNESDLNLFVGMLPEDQRPASLSTPGDIPLQALIPAFMISELRRAFEIGFLLFLPFLIIDLTVASILMSMGMMMLPPVMLSLPFKIIFFVLVDGWHLLAGALVESFK